MSYDNLSFMQSMMTEAYSRWRNPSVKDVTNYQEMLDSCTEMQKYAIVLGNLNYQVENGGFSQWAFNGYLEDSVNLVMEFLASVNSEEVPLAKTVLNLVESAVECWEEEQESPDYCECWEEDLERYGCECGYEEAQCYGPSYDPLDDRFYEVNQAFMAQVEAYMLKEAGKNPSKEVMEMANLEVPESEAKEDSLPKPYVKLLGRDGSALSVVGACRKALKKAGYPREKLDDFQKEALSGDYNQVLQTAMEWCDVR